MARRRNRKGFEILASLPWPAGIAAGLVCFFGIRYLPAWWFSSQGGPLTHGLGANLAPVFALLAVLFLAICWMAALGSFLGSRRRRRLLDTCNSLESLTSGSWHAFELLVGEAFRRRGYAVEETGLGGPDGGIDLILRRQGRKVLVQCKRWKRQQIGVAIVREMAGLLAHHAADEVKIVCVGTFTRDAETFAAGKPIELISGDTLLRMIRDVQDHSTSPTAGLSRMEPMLRPVADAVPPLPSCPRCGGALVDRTNRRTGQAFKGCSQFPRCRGTVDASSG